MSLLEKFKNRFNKTIDVYSKVSTINSIGERIITFPTATITWISCYIFLKNEKYNNLIKNELEKIVYSNIVRIEIIQINIWDKIKDQDNIFYSVEFIYKVPWINWNDDHFLLFVNVIK